MPNDNGLYGGPTSSVTALRVGDILRLVARDEDRAASLHRALAEIIPDRGDQLGYMAVQEQNHRLIVEQLLGEIVGAERAPTLPPESRKYLAALLSTGAFGDPDTTSEVAMTALAPADVLRRTIQAEKDALLMYVELRGLLGEAAARELGAIVLEERSHISDLAELLRRLE